MAERFKRFVAWFHPASVSLWEALETEGGTFSDLFYSKRFIFEPGVSFLGVDE